MRYVATVVLALCLTGCAPDGPGDGRRAPVPEGVEFDYQIGGSYPPEDGVGLVIRDRAAAPEPDVYSVCYVNGFQAQESEVGSWRSAHPDLLLTDDNGDPVIDTDWNEQLLDISTDAKRAALADIVGGWISECAGEGFDGVEIDNLDSPTRSRGRLDQDDALAFARELIGRAHADGLGIGQKNSVSVAGRGAAAGFDFAVAEECARYDECGEYAEAYPGRVYDVEYRRGDFQRACARPVPGVSVVLRDLDVSPPADEAHVRAVCRGGAES